jgi:hypothetical protein
MILSCPALMSSIFVATGCGFIGRMFVNRSTIGEGGIGFAASIFAGRKSAMVAFGRGMARGLG